MKRILVIASIVLGIVVCFQAYWLSKTIVLNGYGFDHSVAVALYSAADSISEQVVVERRSPNYYFVKANTSVSTEEIDTLVRKEFAKRQINKDYEIGIYNAADDSLIHGKYVPAPTLIPSLETSMVNDGIEKNFAVLFPTEENFLFDQGDIWVNALILMAIVPIVWFQVINFRKSNFVEKTSTEVHKKGIGDSILDYKNQVLYVKEQSFQLTHKENQLLNLFFQKPDEVITRDEFLEKVWKQDGFFVARSMDVFISRIRKYLKNDPSLKIENLRSIGYRLVTELNQVKK
ncbi:winged helix-turn-helix domain-containing protein [Ekhidna sp.]|uniref:winged helix-turn-helix domain-containing protein n=1 Tax=Ekhidna sp. TaxID=2608089 RepID=UPI0032F005C1